MKEERRDIRRHLLAVAAPVLMLPALAWIYRRVVLGRVLAGGDLQLYFFPYWMAVVRALRSGQLPLWNPHLFTGAPLLANSQVGIFYPLNWPFWLLAQPTLEGVTRAIHTSVLAHLGLAALNAYALVRLTWRRAGGAREGPAVLAGSAMLAGLVYAGAGFLGVHTEHLNQLQALAWLPLLFLPTVAARPGRGLRFLDQGADLPHPLSIGALAMILLAGHTQMAFIAAVAVAVWHVGQMIGRVRRRDVPVALMTRGGAFLPAGLIAAVQLLPTLELTGLSGRSGGLPWREAVSFSLEPWALPRALMPPYVAAPLLPEGVAYLGLAALVLAVLGVGQALRVRDRRGLTWAALAGLGLFLALGGYNPLYLLAVRVGLPGFVHFRAPARFLALYVLGGAVLAAVGLRRLATWRPSGLTARIQRLMPVLIVALTLAIVAVELDLSAAVLPHAHATTPRAYTDLRPATADLVAAARAAAKAATVPGRFLSISKTLFEVGDKAEIEIAYGDQLSEDALWAYMVASKQREVLAPNLPMAFGVPAADGYDGGILPLRHYTAFTELLLPGGTTDGRLRENLVGVPDSRWLALLGVRHLLTDKTTDAWIDGLLYDRQFRPSLASGQRLEVAWLPTGFDATGLALLAEGEGGVVTLRLGDGRTLDLVLPASATPDEPLILTWDGAAEVRGLQIRADGALQLSGAGLIDQRTGAFYPLVLSDTFRLVHSGDVKIYEALTAPPRAFMVPRGCSVTTAEAALNVMRDPAFDPTKLVVLLDTETTAADPCDASPLREGGAPAEVELVRYHDAEIVVDITTETPAYLVLSDAWYPGWTAEVQAVTEPTAGEAMDVLQADLLFRAVPIAPGAWRVTLTYASRTLAWGTGISLGGLALLAWYGCAIIVSHEPRDDRTG